MKVHIRNPERHLDVTGPRKVGDHLTPCARCLQPTTGRFCAFCRARAQILGERLDPPADEQISREISEEVLPVEVYGGRPEPA